MTSTTLRRIGVLIAPAVALPLALGMITPATAEGQRARITASVTDTTPASGETFRVSGRLTRDGDAIAGRIVKVQALRDGTWSDLTGARMTTSARGTYGLRVILSQGGRRALRVVGVVPGRNAVDRFTVAVH